MSNVMTLADAEQRFNVQHLEHLDREATVPTVVRLGLQGDVAVVRRDVTPATGRIPAGGYPVVRGESGGNTHLLVGDVCFTPNLGMSAVDLVIGVLTVTDGECLLSHPEHGGLLIGPGTYELRRQREMADELRVVAD